MSRWITSPHQIAARERWIKDLQTTKALQGRGALKRIPSISSPPEFCCLGRAIACQPQNTFGLGNYTERVGQAGRTLFEFPSEEGSYGGALPNSLFSQLFGVHPEAANRLQNLCIFWNDVHDQSSFPEIAERLPILFYYADTCEEFK